MSADVTFFENVAYYSNTGADLQQNSIEDIPLPISSFPDPASTPLPSSSSPQLIPMPPSPLPQYHPSPLPISESLNTIPSPEAPTTLPSFDGDSDCASLLESGNYLNLPIVIWKPVLQTHPSTRYPLSDYMSLFHLSSSALQIALSLDSILVPWSHVEAFESPTWRFAMQEEMFALQSQGT